MEQEAKVDIETLLGLQAESQEQLLSELKALKDQIDRQLLAQLSTISAQLSTISAQLRNILELIDERKPISVSVTYVSDDGRQEMISRMSVPPHYVAGDYNLPGWHVTNIVEL